MKLKDFLYWCEENQVSGEETLAININGVIGGAIAFKQASIGFDWNAGKIVLHTDHQLAIYKKAEKPAITKTISKKRKSG